MQPITQKLLSVFNSIKDSLSYGKVVKYSLFLLLVVSSAASLKETPLYSSIVCLVAFIAFELIGCIKRPKFKDHTDELEILKSKAAKLERLNAELEHQFKDIKSDLSLAKISAHMNPRK